MKHLELYDRYRTFKNPYLYGGLFLLLVLAVLSAYSTLDLMIGYRIAVQYQEIEDKGLSLYTAFRFLAPYHFSDSLSNLFILLLPVVTSLVYAWSLAQDRNTGYLEQLLVRETPKNIIVSRAKYTFWGAVCIAAIPLLVNVLMIFMV